MGLETKEPSSPPSPSSSKSLNHQPIPSEDSPLIGGGEPQTVTTTTLSSQPKTLANVFIAIVGAGVLGLPYAFKRTGWDVLIVVKKRPEVKAFGGLSMFFYGMGVALYAFEGVGMVLPLESEMKEKDKFGATLALGMGFISLLYGSFGVLGYFAFGNETKDIITANLGSGLISSFVQLGLCINLFFTFPLMMNPVYEIVERRFWGGSVCCGLGFVLPALFHLLVFKEEMGWKGWSVDVGIVALGLVFAVTGTWYALMEIFSVKLHIGKVPLHDKAQEGHLVACTGPNKCLVHSFLHMPGHQC
ncbi:Transmembrane amino acid transporter family protein [Euphorbia peplus]|nr:Transmembrane amino acid transporter family protein [Euphorbia peplus]